MKDVWKMLGLGIACFLAAAPLFAGDEDGEGNSCKKYGCGYDTEEQLENDVDLEHPEGKMVEEEDLSYLDAVDPIDAEVIQDEMIKATDEGQEPGEEAEEQMDFYNEEACEDPEEEEEEDVAQLDMKEIDRVAEDLEERTYREDELDPWEKDRVREHREEKDMRREMKQMDDDFHHRGPHGM